MVVEPAPRRHAVKVADVVGLRQREELVPGQRHRVLDQPADLEPPAIERDVRARRRGRAPASSSRRADRPAASASRGDSPAHCPSAASIAYRRSPRLCPARSAAECNVDVWLRDRLDRSSLYCTGFAETGNPALRLLVAGPRRFAPRRTGNGGQRLAGRLLLLVDHEPAVGEQLHVLALHEAGGLEPLRGLDDRDDQRGLPLCGLDTGSGSITAKRAPGLR